MIGVTSGQRWNSWLESGVLEFTSQTQRESDIQNGGEVKSHVAEWRLIEMG